MAISGLAAGLAASPMPALANPLGISPGPAPTPLGGERPTPAEPSRQRSPLERACLAAASEAEARAGLPPGLLSSVALIESAAHPFAIGTATRAHYPATAAEAARLWRRAGADASGGCFQINIRIHAARDPAWVFDPWESALFAARKLARHARATGGDWPAALARYAGVQPGTDAARLYRCRVAASLAALGRAQPPGLGTAGCPGEETRNAAAKARTLLARAGGRASLVAMP